MTEKKIIAVVGATGAQGGGLVRAILADPAGPFTARALTRNADSDRARELASQGAEVIEADLDDGRGQTAPYGARGNGHPDRSRTDYDHVEDVVRHDTSPFCRRLRRRVAGVLPTSPHFFG